MSIWYQVAREIEDYRTGIRNLPVSYAASADELRAELTSRLDFQTPIPLSQLGEILRRLLTEAGWVLVNATTSTLVVLHTSISDRGDSPPQTSFAM